ncbi:MAG: LysM peptidoglycan-binding domain-containing protein [Planctomycetota bacterium]|jgi:nucleoid-associated protein YgaU
MGQLERYGLYVLVLVIFLILGVAIWGDEPQASDGTGGGSSIMVPETDLSIPSAERSTQDMGGSRSSGFDDLFNDLEDLPEEQPPAEPGPETISQPATPTEGMDQSSGGAETVAAPASLSEESRTYKIKRFDILGDIAKRELGSAQRWREIADLNPGIDPNNLPIGKVLRLPSTASGTPVSGTPVSGSQVSRASGGFSGGKHTVAKGEYLGSISEKYYGTSRYAEVIKEANNIRDVRALKVGAVLVIPPQPGKN